MKLKIELPYSAWDYKLSGVYRIDFTDGCFYIGCSNHLRNRASYWESIMRYGMTKNKEIGLAVINKIRELINQDARMTIIELCGEDDLKERESFYLDKNKDNPKMVSSEFGAWKPILQYTPKGIFVKKYFSIGAAARYNDTRMSAIQRVLSGERKAHRGMVFIYEQDYHKRREKIVKARSRPVEKKNGRWVLLIDENGNEIKRFKTIVEAGRETGNGAENISRVLSGHQKTAKGFRFKYEEKE